MKSPCENKLETKICIGNCPSDVPPINLPVGIYGTPFPNPTPDNPRWVLGWLSQGFYSDYIYQQDRKWYITYDFYSRIVSFFWTKNSKTDEEAMRNHYEAAREAIRFIKFVFPGIEESQLDLLFNFETSCVPKEIRDENM